MNDPAAVIKKLYRCLKPSGIFAAEDFGQAPLFGNSPLTVPQQLLDWFHALGAREGKHFNYGAYRLYEDMYDAGFHDLSMRGVQPCPSMEILVRTYYLFALEIRERLITAQITTEAEIQQAIQTLADYRPKPGECLSQGQLIQIFGHKP